MQVARGQPNLFGPILVCVVWGLILVYLIVRVVSKKSVDKDKRKQGDGK